MRTYTPKAAEITRAWWLVDADGLVLGRMVSEVARILRGKHKPTFTSNLDCGDHVIVVNAAKVVTTSDKAERTMIHRYSGYPGGLKSKTLGEALSSEPAEAVRRSIKGMLPHNRLGRQMLRKLKVYAGPAHPHQAQKPQQLDLSREKS